MKQHTIFWFAVAIFFLSAVGGIFWRNYSFGEEQAKLFRDLGAAAPHPQRHTIDISSWKTYENKKFGFHFKYPPELRAFPCYGQMLFCMNIGEKNLVFQDNGFAVRIYDGTKLQSRDETGFGERTINGISWHFKIGDTQAFRADIGHNNEFRVFANSQYLLLNGVISTIQFVK